jgi:hypothetical protein
MGNWECVLALGGNGRFASFTGICPLPFLPLGFSSSGGHPSDEIAKFGYLIGF